MTTFDFDEIPCPMPVADGLDPQTCDEILYLYWENSTALAIGNLDSGEAIDSTPDVQEWVVKCLAGHVILTPTSYPGCPKDNECAGECTCDVDHSYETRTFRASDAARLKSVIETLRRTA